MLTDALIVAAGQSTRATGPEGLPKQYATVAGYPVLTHTLRSFITHSAIRSVRVMIRAHDREHYEAAARHFGGHPPPCSIGGRTRQETVLKGLDAIAADGSPPDCVLIHDAARPFADAAVISRVTAALANRQAAIAADPVADTLKRQSATGAIAGTVDRTGLWRAQTPQGFRFPEILAAHRRAAAEGMTSFTDDAALAEWAGMEVALVAGSSRNIKITTPEDLALADALLAGSRPLYETRTGTGFDIHRFAPGDRVWLCGVEIPHDMRLEGHSDADAALHALTDALLGAIGAGDIGHHFPPSDARWRGARSRLFVEHAAALVASRGGRIVNVDLTVLCEAPRIGPHRDAMRAAIAAMLHLSLDRIGVKATTMEGLGAIGRREGVAAMATASVMLPVAI